MFRCRFAPSYFLFLSFFPRDLYPVDSCTVFIGHLRTLEHVMWSVAPTRLDHCLSPMHSESTWFTSVRSLAETDSPGRAQTETRLAASPGVSDMVAFQENPAKLWLYGQQLPTSDSRQATHYGMSAPMVPYQPYQGATAFKPIPEPPVSRWKPRSKTGHTLWRNQLNDRLATYSTHSRGRNRTQRASQWVSKIHS